MRALIIDDDPRSNALLRQALAPYATVTVALTTSSGLEAFRQGLEQASPFDVVFLEIVMPGMDGHQTLQRLRSLEAEFGPDDREATCFAVAQTFNRKSVRRAFFEGGAATCLTKPLLPDTVRSELVRFGLLAGPA